MTALNARYGYNPTTLSHRSALIPQHDESENSRPVSRNGVASGRVSPNPYASTGGSAYSNARTAEDLESQNDEALEGLSAKVKMLKDVCFTGSLKEKSGCQTFRLR